MLRRKLILLLGPLVALFVLLAASALWTLQGILRDMDHINSQANRLADHANELTQQITLIELELYRLESGRERHLDVLISAVEQMYALLAQMDQPVAHRSPWDPMYQRVLAGMPPFARSVAALATAQDAAVSHALSVESLRAASDLRTDAMAIGHWAHDHAQFEQLAMTRRFRKIALAMGVGFLVVMNVAVLALMRVAVTILRPVEKLVDASRHLAREHFDHRVQLQQQDEFDELAQAFNSLAAQLQANERRKLETLAQASLTLNHELNNAMGTIAMQLQLMARQTSGNSAAEKCLRQIQESLNRMAATVESLKHVRRIVLTDYVTGVKMLDLERSVAAPDPPAGAAPATINHVP